MQLQLLCLALVGLAALASATDRYPDTMNIWGDNNGYQRTRPLDDCATNRPNCLHFNLQANEYCNNMILSSLNYAYQFRAMAVWFGREDVALPGFSEFFSNMSYTYSRASGRWMDWTNERGGDIVLQDISSPTKIQWDTALEATRDALTAEIDTNNQILDLQVLSIKKDDPMTADFINKYFGYLTINSINTLSRFVNILTRLNGDPLAEFDFDQQLLHGQIATHMNGMAAGISPMEGEEEDSEVDQMW